MEQESLAASYVEHAVAGFETVMLDKVASNVAPASIVMVTAVAARPIAIEVVLPKLLCDFRARGLVGLGNTKKIVPRRSLVNLLDELDASHGSITVRATSIR